MNHVFTGRANGLVEEGRNEEGAEVLGILERSPPILNDQVSRVFNVGEVKVCAEQNEAKLCAFLMKQEQNEMKRVKRFEWVSLVSFRGIHREYSRLHQGERRLSETHLLHRWQERDALLLRALGACLVHSAKFQPRQGAFARRA